MSLIQEINRTETEKNKTKQVATNIDSKLVELGGEQAINLADVPNKMEVMVKENYKRVASGTSSAQWEMSVWGWQVPMNLKFKPSRIFAMLSVYPENNSNVVIDSNYQAIINKHIHKIIQITNKSFIVTNDWQGVGTINVTWFAVE